MKKIKNGQIYKLRREKNTTSTSENYVDIKETYDPTIEICPMSLYIIKDVLYLANHSKHLISHLVMVDIETGYSETVEVYRIYGDFDEKIILRKIKLKNIIE